MASFFFGDVPDDQKTDWSIVADSMNPIKDYYIDPNVTDILINRYDNIFIVKNGKYLKVDNTYTSELALERFLNQMSNALHQDIDGVLDARFPDCSRACFTTKDVTPSGITVSIRINRQIAFTLDDLVNNNALSKNMSDYLVSCIKERHNFLVCGGTGSGKTTLLRALSMHVPPTERILVAEDTQELNLTWFPNMVSMEAPHRKGSRVNLPFLIKTMLRQNGDRAWVGEIRDSASADAFLQCIDTGTQGVSATMHAPNLKSAIKKLQYLLSSQGLTSYEIAGMKVLENIQVFIQAIRSNKYGRRIIDISYSDGDNLICKYKFNFQTGEYDEFNH